MTFDPTSVPAGVMYRPVPFLDERPIITPRSMFAHTMAARGRSTVESAWNHANANPNTNTLPHYALGLDEADGCQKFLATNRRGIATSTVQPTTKDSNGRLIWPTLTADQQASILAHGNVRDWAIGIETADTGSDADPTISAFTAYQLEMLIRIYVHEFTGWNIPAVPLPMWWGTGAATHTHPFTFPYTTLYRGKICPGDKKKAQFWMFVLPEVARRLAPSPTPTPIPPPSPATDLPTGVAAMGVPLVLRYGGSPTANWSGYFSFDGITRQGVRGMHHAAQLVALGAVDAKSGRPVLNSNWADVTHTTDAEELDEWLTPGRD